MSQIIMLVLATALTGQPIVAPAEHDSMNVRFIGRWNFGMARAIYMQDTLVFLGSGNGVYIIGIENDVDPHLISEFATRGVVMDIFVENDRIYIADGEDGGLEIWDISDVAAPHKLGSLQTEGDASGIFVSGNYAYLADGYDGWFKILDVTDPSNPVQLSRFYAPYASDVYVVGSYAYITEGRNGLAIIDVSDPSNPQGLASFDTPGYATGVYVAGNYAYVADGNSGLRIIDVSNPSSPHEIGYVDNIQAVKCFVADGYAYAASGNPTLYMIDVSDPSNPEAVAYYYGVHLFNDVYVRNGYAYTANGYDELSIIDVRDTTNLEIVGRYNTISGYTFGISAVGNLAYLVGEGDLYDTSGWFRIIDISAPSNPTETGYAPIMRSPRDISADTNYAYIVGFETFQIVEIDTSPPRVIASLDYPYAELRSVTKHGNYAYAFVDSSVCIIDLSDPLNPYEIGRYGVPYYTPNGMVSLFLADTILYVADDTAGLFVLNVSDPHNPTLISNYRDDGAASDIYVLGNYAYLADEWAGLKVLDVSDPHNITEISSYSTSVNATRVYQAGDKLYLSLGTSFYVFDITDPSDPQLGGYYHVSGNVDKFASIMGYVLTAEYDAGMGIYEYHPNSGINEGNEPTMASNIMISNGHLDLSFTVKSGATMDMELFDIAGRRLWHGSFAEGEHHLSQPLHSGIYILRSVLHTADRTRSNSLKILVVD